MHAATGDKKVLERLNYMINWLDSCQRKNGNGYVGGIPDGRSMWRQIAEGKINAGSFSLNDKWVPCITFINYIQGLLMLTW